MNTGIIIGAIAIAIIGWVIGLYNRLIKMSVRVQEGWADIDVQLKRRYDLIPNLVETVKGYASHEQETLNAVIEARSKATAMNIDAGNITAEQMTAFTAAESGLSGALGKLMAISESYPDLKANENFVELQREITDTENKILSARRFYNSTVRDFNTAILSFPGNIVAKQLTFSTKEFFELASDSVEKEPIKVSFKK